jgi:hypothetical protein
MKRPTIWRERHVREARIRLQVGRRRDRCRQRLDGGQLSARSDVPLSDRAIVADARQDRIGGREHHAGGAAGVSFDGEQTTISFAESLRWLSNEA